MPRKIVTSLIFGSFFLFGMLFILWGILLPDIAAELAMSDTISGTLFMLFSFGMMSGALVAGKYVSKFDFLALLCGLFFIDSLFILAISLVDDWRWLLIGVFFVGVTSSSVITIGHTLIARLFEDKRFMMMGIMDFMFSLGTFAASFYVTLLYVFATDWRLPLQLLAVILVCLAVYTGLVARGSRKRMPAEEKSQRGQALAYSDVLKQPVFLFLSLLSFGYGAVEFGNANWFVSYAKDASFSGEQARNLLAFFTAGMTLSRLVFAWFLRFFSVHRLTVILASMALTGAVGVKLTVGFWPIGLSNLLLGLGLGGLFPLVLSAAMALDPAKGPVLSALAMIGNAIGVQTASLITGFWASYHGLAISFYVIPIAALWLWLAAYRYSRYLKEGPAS